MHKPLSVVLSLVAGFFFVNVSTGQSARPAAAAPHLEKRGSTNQFIVDGKPFLVIGGELHNSSSSSLTYMKPIWPKLAAMGLNTVVTPLSWELVEPVEGKYDFSLVDGLLQQARGAHERVVFLWLASWKNGMSSYAPVWVKQDTKRFPRVVLKGKEVEILSPMGANAQQADGRAFTALMRHIKQVDPQHTVLAMQVENEVGVLGDSRDRSATADAAFAAEVPKELTAYLAAHRENLYPSLAELWQKNGAKTSGTWAEVFGATPQADEIFMAWHYARFIQAVTAQGKKAYDLPMYVNTWLGEGENPKPGSYPSGCPEPWVMDVWKAAGTAIDFYAPDLYSPEFVTWSKRYHRDGNPLFMPETQGGKAGAANIFYAFGEEAGFGFSPFAIEDDTDPKQDLAESYRAITAVMPLLAEHQAKGDTHGFLLDKEHPASDFEMDGYRLHVVRDEGYGSHGEHAYGLIVGDGPGRFLGVGKGFQVTFAPAGSDMSNVGIAAVDDGEFAAGKWVPERRLNGDENHQGGAWRFYSDKVRTEKVALYRYQ